MRKLETINQNWSFFGPDGRQQSVTLPHTWNAEDGQDGGNDYWRGSCRYQKYFPMPEFEPDRQLVYLEFDGVNASAAVSLNGRLLGSHQGGYARFRVPVTEALEAENCLELTVDNGVNGEVYPQKADFTFYGGIYRDVRLMIIGREHFSLDEGGYGVKITAVPEGKRGRVRVESRHNAENAAVRVRILDAEGKLAAEASGTDCTLMLEQVRLWDGLRDPYLYTACLTLERAGEVLDEQRLNFGVRSFRVDPKKGFFLNGRPYPLRGVSRHQDRRGLGSALSREHHEEDMALIREIGANAIRLAHYQHDQYFYELCDRYGLIVWAEIPYISEHMPGGRENTLQQLRELIVQNHHHACIAVWGISNEITISTKEQADMLDNHRQLNALCHRLDSTRLTTLACYAMCPPWHRSAHVTDLVGWNLYLGWYVPGLFLNDWWLRFFAWRYPKRPLAFSEYGCEGMPNLHSARPRRGDHSEEYQAVYHEYMLRCFERHPELWGSFAWNMFDFAADARDQGGEPGMNHKGLVSFDRKIKKDSFYLYKAYWSPEPFVYIAGRRYSQRAQRRIRLKIYSNQPEVELYVNGRLTARKQGDKVFCFEVKLAGRTELRVRAGACEDVIQLSRVDRENPDYRLKKAGSSANWV